MKRLSLNENEIILISHIISEIRRNGWEKSGLGSMSFEDMCKLDTKLDHWVKEKVYDMVWSDEDGWVDRRPIYSDTADMFDPYYDCEM